PSRSLTQMPVLPPPGASCSSWLRSASCPSCLKVVADPDGEARLAELVGAADALPGRRRRRAGEHNIFPVLVEERPPRPVEVQREPEQERLEADAVRRAAVLQAEPGDLLVRVI